MVLALEDSTMFQVTIATPIIGSTGIYSGDTCWKKVAEFRQLQGAMSLTDDLREDGFSVSIFDTDADDTVTY